MVQAGGALLEQGNHQHQVQLPGQGLEALAAGSVQRLGQVELAGVFRLAEIQARVQFLQHHQLRAGSCGPTELPLRFGLVGGDIGAAVLLDQGDLKHGRVLLRVIAW